jgi:hypothetical protein
MRLTPLTLTLAAVAGLPALDVPQVNFHGFVSQGALYSGDNNYLADDSTDGSLSFNEVALNASSQISPRLRVGMQLFARDLGRFGNDQVVLDWAFADYHQSEWLGIRAGRYKLPLGLYNESLDLDLAFTSVLLPQSVYDTNFRDILSGANGVQLYGRVPGGFDYQVHIGTQNLDKDSYLGALFKEGSDGYTNLDSLTMHYVVGAQLTWNPPVDGLRLVASVLQVADLEAKGSIVQAGNNPQPVFDPVTGPTGTFVPGDLDIAVTTHFDHITIGGLGVEYQIADWTLATEYRIRYSNYEATADIPAIPILGQGASRDVSHHELRDDGGYLMASYRVNPQWEVGSYYGISFSDTGDRSDPAKYQRDLALSLRCDVVPSWAVKLEGHLLQGSTLVLGQDNPDGVDHGSWWMLAAKTTVSF